MVKINKEDIKKVVLAYSGGLDTSIIISWLKENYDCVIMVRNQYQTLDYASNLKALSQCLARMKSKAKVSLIGDLNEKVVTE